MKKDYVSLNVQVVDVQLSDCIAGSISDFSVKEGTTDITEINNVGGSSISFGSW